MSRVYWGLRVMEPSWSFKRASQTQAAASESLSGAMKLQWFSNVKILVSIGQVPVLDETWEKKRRLRERKKAMLLDAIINFSCRNNRYIKKECVMMGEEDGITG
ncbi:hypothetical protein Nepgr_030742 [Nepenthes gracilis]|uniref:Uncharacterized protein n=1 Tax=Nepenthes gracilis TaxID=150966 RepID=A0AAD3TGS1_NEPGR|nr:hypothetical protein Nepgr_030742 [Nepenthes gracilis]